MKLLLVDVDGTLVHFQPTAELYKRVLLKTGKLKYFLLGYFMLVILKLFWFWPQVVKFQRKLIMSLLAEGNQESLAREADGIALRVENSYISEFKTILDKFRSGNDQVFLLTHCPQIIAGKIARLLRFDGEYSLKVLNYFAGNNQEAYFSKRDLIRSIKAQRPDVPIVYFADDLIDLPPLLAADSGILVNASTLDKCIARTFMRGRITIL